MSDVIREKLEEYALLCVTAGCFVPSDVSDHQERTITRSRELVSSPAALALIEAIRQETRQDNFEDACKTAFEAGTFKCPKCGGTDALILESKVPHTPVTIWCKTPGCNRSPRPEECGLAKPKPATEGRSSPYLPGHPISEKRIQAIRESAKRITAETGFFASDLTPSPPTVNERESLTDKRERFGKRVREIWVAWARELTNPKPDWLLPWESLSEPLKEVDRRIGTAIYFDAVADHQEAIAKHAIADRPADDVLERLASLMDAESGTTRGGHECWCPGDGSPFEGWKACWDSPRCQQWKSALAAARAKSHEGGR